MSYTLTIDQKPAYLHAVVTGWNSKENVLGYMEAIRAECISRGCFRILIEERFDGPRLRLLDIFDIATRGSDLARNVAKEIAFVDVNAEGGLLKFAEDVAVNRGTPVTVFSTVAEAEQWLQRGDTAPNLGPADNS